MGSSKILNRVNGAEIIPKYGPELPPVPVSIDFSYEDWFDVYVINLLNLSTGDTSWEWKMGSVVVSTEQNPVSVPIWADYAGNVYYGYDEAAVLIDGWTWPEDPLTDPDDIAADEAHPYNWGFLKGPLTLTINGGTATKTITARFFF